jgi:DNA-binding NtrC family response regulator
MDDEEILRDIASQMCRRLGLEVETASNGKDAIETYRNAFREGTPFDAVLLDMTIAGGIGGIETAAVLKKIDPEVKNVVMSGYADHEVMSDPDKFGFSAVLSKPFRLNEMSKVLGDVLRVPSKKK